MRHAECGRTARIPSCSSWDHEQTSCEQAHTGSSASDALLACWFHDGRCRTAIWWMSPSATNRAGLPSQLKARQEAQAVRCATLLDITTIVTDSFHGNTTGTDMIVRTVASLAQVSGLSGNVRLVFDGIEMPESRTAFHSRCQSPIDKQAYSAYKRDAVGGIMKLPLGANVVITELPKRGCLSGTVHQALANVSTRFVAIMQGDLPVLRSFDLPGLLALMRADHRVQKVSFTAGPNACYQHAAEVICRAHRAMKRGPVATVTSSLPPHFNLTPALMWGDGNHVATIQHYKTLVLPRVKTGTFMEIAVFCGPWRDHSGWGTFLLGPKADGHYSRHANAGNHSRNNYCMNRQPGLWPSAATTVHGSGNRTTRWRQ